MAQYLLGRDYSAAALTGGFKAAVDAGFPYDGNPPQAPPGSRPDRHTLAPGAPGDPTGAAVPAH